MARQSLGQEFYRKDYAGILSNSTNPLNNHLDIP